MTAQDAPYLPTHASTLKKLLKSLPGYDPYRDAEGYAFDRKKAELAVAFFHEVLTHVKGEKGGQPFVLEEWQKAIVANLFGWVDASGFRRYREFMLFVPRKNGKTPWCAGVVLILLMMDNEPGPEIYSAASDTDQADKLFQQVKGMIENEPELDSALRIYKGVGQRQIAYEAINGYYKIISGEYKNKDGQNTHGVIIDELHAQPNRHLVDVLMTSTAARRQPLVGHATTAGYDRTTICYEKYDYAKKVCDGVIKDAQFLPVIYEADPDDDWTSPKTWKKANPNLGVSVKQKYLERECQRALDEPSYENTFKRLHLNIWTEQDRRWIQMHRWAQCEQPKGGLPVLSNGLVDPAALVGRSCYLGVDISSTQDITALVYLFPHAFDDGNGYAVFRRLYCPAERIDRRTKDSGLPYRTWADTGLLTLTDGDYVDQQHVYNDMKADFDRFDVHSIGVDKWNAAWLFAELGKLQDRGGPPFTDFKQSNAHFDEPCRTLERLVGTGLLQHGGDPVMAWMAGNVTIEENSNGQIRPSKKKSTEKIDGITALLMALGRALVADEPPPSDNELYRIESW